MSTAPPGWHRQPDGQERFWDGTRWTDEFRDPATAPTTAIPTDQTQGMPAGPPPGQDRYAQAGDAYPSAHGQPGQGDAYPREPYYGAGGPPPSSGGMPGWLKGCLFALLALFVIAAIGIVIGWRMLTGGDDGSVPDGTATTAPQAPTPEPTTGPTDGPTNGGGLPTDLPTELPTDFPTELPGAGETVEVSIGDGFALGPGEIQPGWTVTNRSLGFRSVEMKVLSTEATSVPLVFTMTFLQNGAELSQTVCTAGLGAEGEQSDAVCVPMRGDVENADVVRVSGAGS